MCPLNVNIRRHAGEETGSIFVTQPPIRGFEDITRRNSKRHISHAIGLVSATVLARSNELCLILYQCAHAFDSHTFQIKGKAFRNTEHLTIFTIDK